MYIGKLDLYSVQYINTYIQYQLPYIKLSEGKICAFVHPNEMNAIAALFLFFPGVWLELRNY